MMGVWILARPRSQLYTVFVFLHSLPIGIMVNVVKYVRDELWFICFIEQAY